MPGKVLKYPVASIRDKESGGYIRSVVCVGESKSEV